VPSCWAMKRRSSGSSDDGDRHADKPRITSETDRARDDQQLLPALDRRKAGDSRPSSASARSRKSASNLSWKPNSQTQGSTGTERPIASSIFPNPLDKLEKEEKSQDGYARRSPSESPSGQAKRRQRSRSPWAISLLPLATAFAGLGFLALILNSLVTRQIDPKGCRMSYMRPSYAKLKDFDTEHTRFASKYSLYLYREQGIDDENKVAAQTVLVAGSTSYERLH
jgi:GPI inositol-deacylase